MGSTETADAARTFARQVATQSVEDATAALTDDGREAVVDSFPEEFQDGPMDAEDALEQYYWGLYGQYGEFDDVGDVAVENSEDDGEHGESGDGDAEVAVELVFEDGTETATVRVSEGDDITGFTFDPSYEEPAYADPEAFAERDVTVDADDVELDGVLTVPDGDGPFPGVLLVHGAGIHDPDGTAGQSKILRDFAHGLASDGIASLRYEKRLREHEVDDTEFTLDRIVTDDAVAALDELASADEVDPESVFVAGHSQGGMAAPRIADRRGGIAGVVNLDGRADSTLDPDDLGFMRYEFELDGDLDDEQEAQLEDDRETARRIDQGDFDDGDTLWGRPGTWHRSVRDYDPSGTASGLECPVFVANTRRADEELQPELDAWLRSNSEQWRTADLPAGSRVERYDGLDHYFQPGYAPATPLSLYFGGNVAEYVVDDVAEWIHDVAEE
ncbi:alpha/beta hydrolase family protein [Halobacterium zhouii]|uniref:alpha/beta hydrolase family protein n=1 Tax=Halobacterium zhouii TaxID=2902624 RepID=UPI001E631AC5|nr:alpha/beta fold hydrolase [Halobacterium zhouii]